MARTFAVDVLACPKCHGRMKSRVLRRQAFGDEDAAQGRRVQETA